MSALRTIARATVVSHPYTSTLAGLAIIYFIIYPIVEYLYDRKGLRKYPNAFTFAGVSNLPFILLSHGGARSSYLERQHRRHPILRIGPNAISFSETCAIKDIYGHGSKCAKDAQYVVTAGSHHNLADVVDKADHSRKRKVLSAAYALKNLEAWEFKVADKTQILIKHLDKCCTAPLLQGARVDSPDLTVDYRAWTNFFTLDAIADMGLSERLNFLENGNDLITCRRPDGNSYECQLRPALYETARKQSLLVWSYRWYSLIDKVSNILPYYSRMTERSVEWNGFPEELSLRRLERYNAGEKLDDFFQALMEDKAGNRNNLEWGEIVAEISIMMNAGSVTTAIAMTNVLYQLIRHPETMAKLRDELDKALDDDTKSDDDAVVPYDRIKHLPYLRACLDESLRLFPPTPHNLPRQTPSEGLAIGEEFIAGNVTVGMTALAVHWNGDIFPRPHDFVPERWLGDEGKRLQPFFLAFSVGARGCIGRNISYLEQTILLASVLRRYEFALPSEDWEMSRLETFNWLLGEMPVKVWRRERR